MLPLIESDEPRAICEWLNRALADGRLSHRTCPDKGLYVALVAMEKDQDVDVFMSLSEEYQLEVDAIEASLT